MGPPPSLSDPTVVLIGVSTALLVAVVLGIVVAARARRRRARLVEEDRVSPASDLDVARWIEEGRRLFILWQERIERLNELRSQLAAMAHEIGKLQAQVGGIDELRAELGRLGEEIERLRAERDALRQALARIAELARTAEG
jgi:chromosome segregation ATPase